MTGFRFAAFYNAKENYNRMHYEISNKLECQRIHAKKDMIQLKFMKNAPFGKQKIKNVSSAEEWFSYFHEEKGKN